MRPSCPRGAVSRARIEAEPHLPKPHVLYANADVSMASQNREVLAIAEDSPAACAAASGPATKFMLTANEHRRALDDDEWLLAIVLNALDPRRQDYLEFETTEITGAALPITYVVQLSRP
jgi:hypothetical protein